MLALLTNLVGKCGKHKSTKENDYNKAVWCLSSGCHHFITDTDCLSRSIELTATERELLFNLEWNSMVCNGDSISAHWFWLLLVKYMPMVFNVKGDKRSPLTQWADFELDPPHNEQMLCEYKLNWLVKYSINEQVEHLKCQQVESLNIANRKFWPTSSVSVLQLMRFWCFGRMKIRKRDLQDISLSAVSCE